MVVFLCIKWFKCVDGWDKKVNVYLSILVFLGILIVFSIYIVCGFNWDYSYRFMWYNFYVLIIMFI